jgi:ribulose-phosphate 3-epimerase
MSHYIAPSVLAADFTNLEKDLKMVNTSEADFLHVDIMDGVFVPAISFGQNIVKQINAKSIKPLDVHLMIIDPDRYIKDFAEAGAEIITVHYEACTHLHRTIQLIKSVGCKAGVAINPHTPANLLDPILEDLDLICVMSVNPGFGGQKFIYNTLEKLRYLRSKIIDKNLKTLLEVDGGVGLQNAQSILEAGADLLVAGSAVFKSESPAETISKLKTIGNHTFSA